MHHDDGPIDPPSGHRKLIASSDAPGQAQRFIEIGEELAEARTIDLADAITSLRAALATTPMVPLLSYVAAQENRGIYREYLARPLVVLEYLTWLYLLDSSAPLTGTVTVETAQRITDQAHRCVTAVHANIALEHVEDGGVGEARRQTRIHELLVRGPGYGHHVEHQHRGLFTPMSDHLTRMIGFSIDEIYAALWAMLLMTDRKLESVAREATVAAEFSRRRRGPLDFEMESLGFGVSPELLGERTWMRNAHALFRIAAPELASSLAWPEDRAYRFLQFFSLKRSRVATSDDKPSAREGQLQSPLVDLEDGTYLVHMISHLLWAIKPRLERALKGDARTWERYQRVRSRYLEERSVELLRSVSRHASGWTRLRYRRSGEASDDELDGLVLVDDVAFIIEAKSGSMSPAARRGAPSVREDLRNLVGEAYGQLDEHDDTSSRMPRSPFRRPRVASTSRKRDDAKSSLCPRL